MGTVAGFPFIEAQFGKDGQPVEAAVARGVVEFAQREQLTDLLVLSHGWNNDMADARDLYSRLLAQVRAVLDAGVVPAIAGRTLGVVGVFWPSKKFTDAELIPGGAASLGDGLSEDDTIRDRLDGLKGMFDKPDAAALEAAKQLVGAIEDDPAARRKFVDLVRSVLPEPTDERDDASGTFFHLDGDDIFRLLEAPGLGAPPASSSGGAAGLQDAGGAAGLFDVLSGTLDSV